MERVILQPCVSLGGLIFGDKIENYPQREWQETGELGGEKFQRFHFCDVPVSAYTDGNDAIESVHCHSECWWNEVNLIGLPIEVFRQFCGCEISDKDLLPLAMEGYAEEQWQDVYGYDDLGLQLWVFNGEIVTVIACVYS